MGRRQAGVAAGVANVVAAGVVDGALVDDLVLIAAVWVAPDATDEALVFDNNRTATTDALAAGRERHPPLDDVLARRDEPWNPFFRPR